MNKNAKLLIAVVLIAVAGVVIAYSTGLIGGGPKGGQMPGPNDAPDEPVFTAPDATDE